LGIGVGIILTEEPYSDKILMYFRNFFTNWILYRLIGR
jgi:hypothetical protein